MPEDEGMEPLERLLNLVGLLLETEHPMTFEEIRRTLAAYSGDNLDSAKRKFERDKDILREYGVPLEMAATDVWDVEQGYTIPKDRYYLPEIAFTPEEVTALFVAAQSASEETVAARGVRKLVYGAEGGVLAGAESGPLVAGSDTRSARVLAAADAASARRRVRFGYRTSQGAVSDRAVDAYGVVFRGGHRYVGGHDEERDAAAEIFGVPREQLRRDLDLLFMSGLPPYGPGDLIDVDVDEDGGVWISMADHFARPLRLTRPEALAVYLRATELLATPGIPDAPALASALAKLRDALGSDTLGDAAGIEGAVTGSAPAHLDALRAAAADLRRIRIEYTAAS